MLLKLELKQLDKQVHYFFRGGWVVGWVGGVEELRIKPSQLSTKLKLKLKLSLAIFTRQDHNYMRGSTQIIY